MIRINLLPPDIEGTSERKINPAYVVAGVGGVLAVVLSFHASMQYSKRTKLLDEIKVTNGDLERYKPVVAQVEQLEQAKSQLQQRKNIIQQLENERLRYPYFMEDFLKLLPNNVWLLSLTTTLPADGATMTVSMDVTALDHYAVADLVSNLETSQIFTDVDLGPITMSQGQTGQTINFHISTVYKKSALNTNAPQKS